MQSSAELRPRPHPVCLHPVRLHPTSDTIAITVAEAFSRRRHIDLQRVASCLCPA